MSRTILIATLLVALSTPTYAGEYMFCLLMNRVAAADKLRDYSDKQIENGLCVSTKEVVDAIAARDSTKQQICLEASASVMKEFKRRFPNRDPKTVAGKC